MAQKKRPARRARASRGETEHRSRSTRPASSAAGASRGTRSGRRRTADAPRATATRRRRKAARSETAATGRARRRSSARGGGRQRTSRSLTPAQAQRLLQLEESLRRRIIGKDEAVARIARAIRVRMTQLDFQPGRPNGSFLLVGPSGVGKNELVYALAEALQGREDVVVSIDLAEISEEGDLAKLGATLLPGSGTQTIEGLLTSPVRTNPDAIVLFRGLERVHASFYPILQQILERGRLDDMVGPVDFSRSVIFVTTRPRRDESPAGEIGFSRSPLPASEALHKRLERSIPAELLDSFNEIIELPPPTTQDVRRIARYKVEAVLGRLSRSRRQVQVAENVYEAFLPEEEVQREGVGILHRTLEDRLFNPLAVYLLSHPGRRSIRVDLDQGTLRIQEGSA